MIELLINYNYYSGRTIQAKGPRRQFDMPALSFHNLRMYDTFNQGLKTYRVNRIKEFLGPG